MNITDLHTVVTNLKGNYVRKLDIYSARTAQLISNNLQEYTEGPPMPRRNQDLMNPEFNYHILQHIGLNESYIESI